MAHKWLWRWRLYLRIPKDHYANRLRVQPRSRHQHVFLVTSTECVLLIVLVSAGFDAAEGDQLGQCHVSPAAYGHMTHMLCALAQGKVVVALEVCTPFR
jgi:hypothetical protein